MDAVSRVESFNMQSEAMDCHYNVEPEMSLFVPSDARLMTSQPALTVSVVLIDNKVIVVVILM